MIINIQYILALVYILITLMLLCLYLIRYGRIMGFDMGTKIGDMFIFDKFKMSEFTKSKKIDELKKSRLLLCFVSTKCPSCEEALKIINEEYIKNMENIYIIAHGNKSEVEMWYSKNNYNFYAGYIEKEVLFNDLKINRFPYSFSIEYSVVKNKGPLFKHLINNYISQIN